jgi:hypothetical protein
MLLRKTMTIGLLFVATHVAAADSVVTKEFSAEGVAHVFLRSGLAAQAEVRHTSGQHTTVTVSGTPIGGAQGYHPSDPNWKETPAADWGLEFVGQRFGTNLVISSKNEIQYIHHHYALDHVVLTLPEGVDFKLITRELSGDGKPDLSIP